MTKDFIDNTVQIILNNVVLDVRIGLEDHEKGRTQRILVNIALYAQAGAYLSTVTPETLINYNVIHSALQNWANRPHVELIETYVNELLVLCFEDPRVEAVDLSITKPDIYDNAEEVGVRVSMSRTIYQTTYC